MTYYRENTGSTGVGIGWERSVTTTFFYIRVARWHHEWSWPRG